MVFHIHGLRLYKIEENYEQTVIWIQNCCSLKPSPNKGESSPKMSSYLVYLILNPFKTLYAVVKRVNHMTAYN